METNYSEALITNAIGRLCVYPPSISSIQARFVRGSKEEKKHATEHVKSTWIVQVSIYYYTKL